MKTNYCKTADKQDRKRVEERDCEKEKEIERAGKK